LYASSSERAGPRLTVSGQKTGNDDWLPF
jgi:hypothetical protein